jgi:hypothetical protein
VSSIGGYDGLAVRSATKADKEVIAAATRLKVIGRAGIGVDNKSRFHRMAKRHVVTGERIGPPEARRFLGASTVRGRLLRFRSVGA